MRKLSNNAKKCVETNPTRCEEMPKRRRGRPPGSKSTKSVSINKTNKKNKDLLYPNSNEEVDYDANLRRESYNISVTNNESKVATVACSPQQLIQLGDRHSSYKDSLIKFSKDLGPTARKVAIRKLQGQGLNYQARYQLGHFVQSSEAQPTPCFQDLNPIIGLVGNTRTNQVSQPLISFGNFHTDASEIYKGKNVVVNDGANNRQNKNMGNNLEFLVGKQKAGGVQIGNGLADNQNVVLKNVNFGQVGNQRTINQVGSFFPTYNDNLNQNSSKIPGIEDVSDQNKGFWNASEVPSGHGKVNSRVYPSTYVPPSRKFSSSLAGFDGTQLNSIPWAPSPSVFVPPHVQPLQNWHLPPPETKYSVAMNDFLQDQDMKQALAFNMQMIGEESNDWFQNLHAPRQLNQFLQPNLQQPQDHLLMPMSTHMLSQMETNNLLSFGTNNDFGYLMENRLFHQPPSF